MSHSKQTTQQAREMRQFVTGGLLDSIVFSVRIKVAPLIYKHAAVQACRMLLVVIAVGLHAAAVGLTPPYPYADLLPISVFAWGFEIGAILLVAWAIEPASTRLWVIAWIWTLVVLVGRTAALLLLTDVVPWTPVGGYVSMVAMWAALGPILAMITGAAWRNSPASL